MKKLITFFFWWLPWLFFFSVSAFAEGYTVGMVVKNVGNPFMDAAGRGGERACGELGNSFIFQGPATQQWRVRLKSLKT